MNGDLSRVTFDPLKHYLRVVSQQGRVQLDADLNEQTAILLHFLQTLAADLIGQHGGPIDLTDSGKIIRRNLGFEIITRKDQLGKVSDVNEQTTWNEILGKIKPQILISKGRYYVDGRLCEIENYLPYSHQPGYPWLNEQGDKENFSSLPKGSYLVYLDVWERYVTSLEDPEIREVALGGADTAARSKLVCQVKIKGPDPALGSGVTCKTFNWDLQLNNIKPKNRGKLKAKAKEDAEPGQDEPCITAPDARFRGAENQLYRVEIHRSGPAWDGKSVNSASAATFKWSRDNASIVTAYKAKKGDDLIVSGLRDSTRWFSVGQWVEITHDGLELRGEPGLMAKLTKVDGETLTVEPNTVDFEPGQPGVVNPKVRRWDHKDPSKDSAVPLLNKGAILIRENTDWIDLEDGIRIQFPPPAPNEPTKYRTGDYWLIPARVATGDVEWPGERDNPMAVAPHGIEHYYAPLAIINLAIGGNINAAQDPIDLRHKFLTLAECKPER
ncbi:MAG: DUF6519 domain-containing protein [Blastocatellia bacterium]